MKKAREKKKIRVSVQLYMVVAPLLLAVLFSGLIAEKLYRRTLTEEMVYTRLCSVQQVAKSIDMITAQIASIVTLISEDEQIKKMCSSSLSPQDQEYLQLMVLPSLSNRYTNYLDNQYMVFDLYLISESGLHYNSLQSNDFNYAVFDEHLGRGRVLKNRNHVAWGHAFLDTENQPILERSMRSIASFPVARGITNALSGESTGIMFANFPHKVIQQAYQYLQNDSSYGEIYIVDRNGWVVSAQNEDMLSQSVSERPFISQLIQKYDSGVMMDSDNMVIYSPVNNSQWMLVEEVNLTEYFAILREIRHTILGILIVVFMLTLLFIYFGVRGVTAPIVNLSLEMNRVGAGFFQLDETCYKTRELETLRVNFNKMQRNIQKLIENVHREEKRKRELELAVLQAQINPHFMYNTIYSIRCQALLNEDNEVADLLESLIRLLRLSIGNNQEYITLEDELGYLRDYLHFQLHSAPDSFKTHFQVDEELLGQMIPKMLLQPIVENAVNHGMRPTGYQCDLYIRIALDGQDIAICIENNGVPADINRLQAALNGTLVTEHSFTKIGLRNVNERLVTYYGEAYRLKVEAKGTRTSVFVRIPYIVSNRNDDGKIKR